MDIETPHFIVVEGLTGSGKSSVADLLAERSGLARPSITPTEFRDALAMVENEPALLDSRFHLYMASVIVAAASIHRLLREGTGVVVDSWWYRTVATHVALGSSLELMPPPWIPEPTVAVFLHLDEAERRRRIEHRGRPSGYWKTLCEDCGSQLLELYRSIAPQLRYVDAGPPLLSVVEEIELLLQ